MMIQTNGRLVVVLSFSLFFLLGLHENVVRTTVNGFNYVAIGGTSLDVNDGVFVVNGLDAENSGISIDVASAPRGDILFDPIPIREGSTFSARALDQKGHLIADFELVQRGLHTTEVWLNLGERFHNAGISSVGIFARTDSGSDSGVELRFEIPENRRIFVGTVTAPTAAWAKTYHWLCAEGECHLIIDPDETMITFSSAPNEQVPFRYLGVVLKMGDENSFVSTVELTR